MMKKYLIILAGIYFLLPSLIQSQESFWVQTNGPNGTANYNGRIAFHKNDIYLGSNNGLYHSSGYDFKWNNIGFENKRIKSISLTSDGKIYCCTYDPYDKYKAYLSNNNGYSWEPLIDSLIFHKIAIDSADNIYAVINKENNTRKNVYRLLNGKLYWEKCFEIFSDFYIFDIKSDPEGDIWLFSFNHSKDRIVYFSQDYGDTWSSSQLPKGEYNGFSFSSNNEIFVGSIDGIYYASKEDLIWKKFGNFEGKVIKIQQNKKGEYIVATEKNGLFISSDDGKNWHKISEGIRSKIWSINLDLNDYIYLFTTIGLYFSHDNGLSWNLRNEGITDFPINALATDNAGNIYAGSLGLFRSSDKGKKWEYIGLTDELISDIAVNSKGHIFVGGVKGFRSTDEGKTWTDITPPHSIYSIAFSENDDIFVGCFYNVYRSTNNGDDWVKVNDTLAEVKGLAFNSEEHIFATYPMSGIYRSTDYGISWEIVLESKPLNNMHFIYDLDFAPRSKIGYMGVASPDQCLLYISYDNGNTWSCNEAYPGGYIGSIGIDSLENVYINGYYRSTDNGISWEDIRDGILNRPVYDVAVDPDGYVYLATGNGGVYRSKKNYVSVKENKIRPKGSIALNQNIPNPFSENTEITYSLDKPGYVQLSIFDMLGIKAAEPVNCLQDAGTHTVTISNNNYPQGLYFYTLKADGNSITKKMQVIR